MDWREVAWNGVELLQMTWSGHKVVWINLESWNGRMKWVAEEVDLAWSEK